VDDIDVIICINNTIYDQKVNYALYCKLFLRLLVDDENLNCGPIIAVPRVSALKQISQRH
jgi:hypothetical protein